MRVSRVVIPAAVFILLLSGRSAGQTSTSQALRNDAHGLFQTGELPLIFVGKIVEADMSVRPCRISCGTRWATYSVDRLLFGFSPGPTVKIAYDSGVPPPLFSSKSELLIVAVGGYSGIWKSTVSLLAPATDENVREARQIAADRREWLITNYKAHHTTWRKLAFVGTVTKLPEPATTMQPCKQARPFPVVFQVDEWLSESKQDKDITVTYGDCVPPPDPPFRVGEKMIVLAGETAGDIAIGYLKDLLPVDEVESVRRKLRSNPH
jgi:hypothetical protein